MTLKNNGLETSLAVQQLRPHASNAGGVGLIPSPGTKIPHATRCGKKKKMLLMLLFVWCMIGSSGGSLRWGSGSTMPETQLLSLCPSAVCLTCFLHHKMAGAGQVSPSIFLRNTKTFPEEAFTFLSLLRSGSHTHLLINSWPKVLRLCYPATARRLTRIEANITAAAFEKRAFSRDWETRRQEARLSNLSLWSRVRRDF